MEITGTVENIIFRNSENGYTVLELWSDDGDPVTAVGPLAICNPGERITLSGQYTSHPKYGQQFKADSCSVLAPATVLAIETYLGSGVIKGIGPSLAHQIVRHFGMDTLDILDNDPERLQEIAGIGPKKCAMIMDSYRESRETRDIILALEPYGVTVSQAMKLYSIYGKCCVATIEEDPYRIIKDVDGFGFVTADRIAQNVPGYSASSKKRICAGLNYALEEASMEYGHTCLPWQTLSNYTSELLGVETDIVDDRISYMIQEGELVSQKILDYDMVFLPWLLNMEQGIAERLLALSEKPGENPFLLMTFEQSAESRKLANQQKEAVKAAFEEGVLVITGGPGTGKTTIIKSITKVLEEMQMEFVLCAPTGRAAKRMTEATGFEAKTIHRLLEYIPNEGFQRNQDDPLFYDMIVVDEMSMVDVPLMYALLKAVPVGTRLILVGDSDQLPSVGCGDVLRNIIESGAIRTVRLTEVFRQSKRSGIVLAATSVNRGEMPDLDRKESEFLFEEIASQDDVLNRVIRLCTEPGSVVNTSEPLMDIQVIVPMKKGTLGVRNINTALQTVLNPPLPGKREHMSGEKLFREGDKIMQMQNDYKVEWTRQEASGQITEGTGVFNGDIGTVYAINTAVRRMTILFDDGRLAEYEFGQTESLDLAYCISVHKSQGSEFPVVILPLCGGTPVLLTRNLLYTAITRARSQVICLGRRETIQAMVSNNRSTRRYTSLRERMQDLKYLEQLSGR